MKLLYRLIFLITLSVLIFETSVVFAQNTGEIKGTIIDLQRKESLIGANVLIEGTNLGANSDFEGYYFIKNVPAGRYNVLVRFVGYKQQRKEVTVTAGSSIELKFNLEPTMVEMNEVVVTGQGAAVEKRKLPTTVETISSQEIGLAPVKSLDQLLQGRVPGFSSFNASGLPGTGMRLQTRGIKSTMTSTTPVVYVDGVRMDNNDNYRLSNATGGQVSSSLADIVVNEIDRVEIIKGGAASTLYGSEAANGVIQIFTKKGTPGIGRWRINATTGIDAPELQFTREQYTKDKFFKNGYFQSYSVNLSGGTDFASYNVTGKVSNNTGVIKDDKIQDKLYNLTAGLRAVLSDVSTLEASANYVFNRFGFIFNDNNLYGPLSVLEIEGNFRPDLWLAPGADKDSLLRMYLLPEITETVNRFTSSATMTYKPFQDFTNKITVGIDYRNNNNRQFAPIEAQSIVVQPGGFLRTATREFYTATFSYTGSYKLPEISGIEQTVSFGAQGFRVEDRESFANGVKFAIPGTKDFDNAANITAGEDNRQFFNGGFFASDMIGLWDKVFIDLGIRFDGNSTFGKDIGMQTYPKAGIAYNISKEGFYPEGLKEYVSTMKLRASWGMTGNFPTPFTRDRTYASYQYLSEAALNFNNPGNSDLKPEKTTSIDVGFDAGFWDDRISLELTYFDQVTKDALFNVPTDPATGFGNQLTNVGEISNKGIELSLKGNLLRMNDLEVSFRSAIATLKNEVTALGKAAPFTSGGFSYAPNVVQKGMPVGAFRVSVPIKEADGTYAGNYRYDTTGNPTPTLTGSFGLDLTLFKDLTITGFLEFATGHKIINQSLGRMLINGYSEVATLLPVSTVSTRPYTRNTAASYILEDADWWKIREVSIRYNLPKEIIKGVSITFSMRNLLVFGTKTTMIDPELYFIRGGRLETGGVGGANVSPPKQFRLGIDFTF